MDVVAERMNALEVEYVLFNKRNYLNSFHDFHKFNCNQLINHYSLSI